MRKLLSLGLLIISLGTGLSAQDNAKPFVVPELTSWHGATGMFVPSGRIIVQGTNKELQSIAKQFAADYYELHGRSVQLTTGKVQRGDFVLSLNKDKKLGAEGYQLVIGDITELRAYSPKGLYWGTRTILQIGEQHPELALPRGTTTDIPRYALRGLLMDVGRKYIPMNYLNKLVKVMAYYKMNTLQVHLNDNGFKQFFGGDWDKTSSAFRLESSTYPDLAIKGASYSKQEFIDFQIQAERQYVEIIPEIDVPAHSLAFSRIRPEIASKEYGKDHLDLFNEETYKFVDALFDEYLSGPNPVFRSKRINIGTDEYSNAKEDVREKFRYFTDRYIKYVQKYGKQAALWGALTHAYGKTPVTSKDVVMMCWYNGYADPKAMKEAGYQIVSIPDSYTYIVPAAGYYYDYLDTDMLYKRWTPAQIGNQKFEDQDPSILGGMFAVWNDHYGNGITVKDIHHRVIPAMQMIALKTWTAHDTSVPLDVYNTKRHLLSEAPGVNELARIGKPSSVVYTQSQLRPGNRLPHEEIGYNYKVHFTIEPKEEVKGTELFRSENAVFYLSDPKSGRLGFARDGYLNTFSYTLPEAGKVQLTIEGNNKETKLYIDGKHRETLGALTLVAYTEADRFEPLYESPDPFTTQMYKIGAKMNYQRTLVFPLRIAGKFRSKITDLRVERLGQ